MKRVILILMLLSIASALISCSKTSSNSKMDEVIKFTMEYKKEQFNVKNYSFDFKQDPDKQFDIINEVQERMSPYLTDKYLQYQMSHRTITLPLFASRRISATSYRLDNQHYEIIRQEQNTADISYDMDVVFLNDKNKEVNNTKMKGTLTLVKSNNVWKVDSDRFNVLDFSEIKAKN